MIHGEAAQRALQRVQRQAEIEERAEHHVPRGAGEAIEIEHRLSLQVHTQPSRSPRSWRLQKRFSATIT